MTTRAAVLIEILLVGQITPGKKVNGYFYGKSTDYFFMTRWGPTPPFLAKLKSRSLDPR